MKLKHLCLGAVVLGALGLMPTLAEAGHGHTSIDFSFGIGFSSSPHGYYPRYYQPYYPRVYGSYYYRPAPVYVPPPVYVAPPVRYYYYPEPTPYYPPPPVYYERSTYYYGGSGYYYGR